MRTYVQNLAPEAATPLPTTGLFDQVAVINRAVRVERRQLEGREHLVVPVVMLVEGIHNGSGGPLFYPASEFGKTLATWNGRPVVLFHPDEIGKSSAGDPSVFDSQRVGTVFNARSDGKRLLAEAWLDVAILRAKSPDLLKSVERGEPVEVSTGVYTANDLVSGTWNGEQYDSTARNLIGDHLAILPGRVGACSIADGCGLLRNEESHAPGQPSPLPVTTLIS